MYILIFILKLPVNLDLLQEKGRLTSFAYSSERVKEIFAPVHALCLSELNLDFLISYKSYEI